MGDDAAFARRITGAIDKCVTEGLDLRLTFDDETDDYKRAVAIAKPHIKANGYHQVYEFWYDGCNYGGEDYIRGRPIKPDNGSRGGSCWASSVWTFDDVEQAPPPPPPPERAEECVVCQDAPPDTLVAPCGHVVVCHDCSDALVGTSNAHICVVCRQPIESIYRNE